MSIERNENILETELKTCPFCGGEVTVDYNEYTNKYSIACGSPECSLCVVTYSCDTKEQAIEIWNRRADNDA